MSPSPTDPDQSPSPGIASDKPEADKREAEAVTGRSSQLNSRQSTAAEPQGDRTPPAAKPSRVMVKRPKKVRFTDEALLLVQQLLGKLRTLPQTLQPALKNLGPTLQQLPTTVSRLRANLQPQLHRFWEAMQPMWRSLRSLWAIVLDQIRRVLPSQVSRNLPDSLLTGVILGLVLLVLTITSSFSTPARATAPTTGPFLVEPTPIPAKRLPLPEPTKLAAAEPTPLSLIEEQVTSLTNRYEPGLVQFVQADRHHDRLTIQFSDAWYHLSQERQDALTNELWQQAKELNVQSLTLTDAEPTLLARSPVVGDRMVVVKRRLESPTADTASPVTESPIPSTPTGLTH